LLLISWLFIIDSPSPGHYNLQSEFDVGHPKKGGTTTKGHLYTFGASHSVYKKVYNPENPVIFNTEKLPGPGSYENTTMNIGVESKKYGI
jgi:hypothetical protein